MELIVNETSTPINTTDLRNATEVVEHVQAHCVPPGHVVTRITLNGTPVAEELEAELSNVSAADIQELRVTTADPSRLALSGLQESVTLVDSVATRLAAVAEDYRFGRDSQGRTGVIQAANALEMFVRFLNLVRTYSHLERSGRAAVVTESTLTFERRLNEMLMEVVKAQENQDWILLADLLEYELIPVLRDWTTIRDSYVDDLKQNIRAA